MINHRRRAWLYAIPSILSATDAWAQASSVTPTFDWRQLVGVLINTVGVLVVVQVIKYVKAKYTDKYDAMLPVVAVALGPCLMALQGFLTSWLGFQGFDFTPISAALTGSLAVTAHQVYAQAKKP